MNHGHDHHDHDHAHDHDHGHGHAHGDGHHHHHHHHDHGHGVGLMEHNHYHPDTETPLNLEELDPANRSLAEALRLSFGVLKWAMIILLVVFLFSGWFNVKEGEVAIRTRFGAVLGQPGEQVLEPGGPYFAFPEPIDQVITIPTTDQRLTVGDAFWFNMRPNDRTRALDEIPIPQTGLIPGLDGSLITGDKNIVHGRWSVIYKIRPENAARFVGNVGSMTEAQRIVRSATEQGIVHAVAQTSADEFVQGTIQGGLRGKIQEILDRMESGISVTSISFNDHTPPLATRAAFQAVAAAESEKAQKIELAKRDRSRILNEVAGSGYEPLLQAIDLYEEVRRGDDGQVIAQVEQQINELLVSDLAGGRVSETISEARTYATQVKETVRAEAERFARLLPLYQQNPAIVRDRLLQDAKQQVLSGDAEKFYLPNGVSEMYIELNRDPAIEQRREQERYQRQLQPNQPQ